VQCVDSAGLELPHLVIITLRREQPGLFPSHWRMVTVRFDRKNNVLLNLCDQRIAVPEGVLNYPLAAGSYHKPMSM
jgi:hypothetical protein